MIVVILLLLEVFTTVVTQEHNAENLRHENKIFIFYEESFDTYYHGSRNEFELLRTSQWHEARRFVLISMHKWNCPKSRDGQ